MMNRKHVPRKTAVLYLTATCNLKCKYCYIDKSPSLVDIDTQIKVNVSEFKEKKELYEKKNYFNGESKEEIANKLNRYLNSTLKLCSSPSSACFRIIKELRQKL